MFEKLKQIKKLQEIQGALKNEKVENEKTKKEIKAKYTEILFLFRQYTIA